MGGETKKAVLKSSNVPTQPKKTTSDVVPPIIDDVRGVMKGAVDTKIQQGIASAVKTGADFGRKLINSVPSVEAAMAKNALGVLSKGASVASKVIPVVGGGVPSAISAVMGDGTQGASQLRKKGYVDGTSPEQWAQLQKEQRMRTSPMKNMLTTKMVSTTVKNPAYSGQSTMGKALMASAKKRG